MRVVVGEDSVLFREGLRRLLAEFGHHTVEMAGDGPSAVAAVDEHRPDVVILDIRMPPGNASDGVEAAAIIRERHPRLGVLLLSQHITHLPAGLVAGGAFGYMLKDRVLDVADFVDAVERVAAGGSALDPEAVAGLMSAQPTDGPMARLTAREREVLDLMAQGLTNAGIARRLWLTERTVETHISSVFAKLGLLPDANEHRRVRAVLTYLEERPGTSSAPRWPSTD